MQVLAPGRKAPDVEHVLDGISFINFNYDRCLEQFLIHGLHLLYGIPKEEAVGIVDKADIIHPYGTVGALARVPFGGNEEIRLDYAELGQGIKTYTERVEEEKERECLRRFEGYLRRLGLLDDETAERVKAEALEAMREGIAAAEAEPAADPELVFAHAYADPPPTLREGWLGG